MERTGMPSKPGPRPHRRAGPPRCGPRLLLLLLLAAGAGFPGCGPRRGVETPAVPGHGGETPSSTGKGSKGTFPLGPGSAAWRARAAERLRMVEEQIAARGVKNPRVLAVLREIPRHLFVPESVRTAAYRDTPLPIGRDQTISQPYIVALMTEALDPRPGDRVLEIGTGSGYQAAVLARLVKEVYTVEIIPELGKTARKRLASMGLENVHVRIGDGYRGWPEAAPFDKIIVTAAPERVPPPLLEQLKPGGRLVIPVGKRFQQLKRIVKTPEGIKEEPLLDVLFVPMTGEAEGVENQ